MQVRSEEDVIQALVSTQQVPSISIDKLKIIKMLNLKNDDDIDPNLPLLVSSAGSPKLLVLLKSFESLSSLNPNFNLIAEWSIENTINGLYVYTNDVRGNNLNFYARGFNKQ